MSGTNMILGSLISVRKLKNRKNVRVLGDELKTYPNPLNSYVFDTKNVHTTYFSNSVLFSKKMEFWDVIILN